MNISEPEIKLMPPSPVELCEAQKKKKGNVTLVCLVTDFYPDHISIVWKVNGENRTHRVATDHAALQDPDTRLYSMSSRLRVNETEWTNIKNKFKCSVTFYKEDEYVVLEDTIIFSPGKMHKHIHKMNITLDIKIMVLNFRST